MENDNNNYEKAHQHWVSVASNLNGMLGGFERLHSPDINGSKQFLDEIAKKALDCGSGIGRVTKYLLLPAFHSVDMVDFAENFIEQSTSFLGDQDNARIGSKFVESLHTFSPESAYYDLIWVQWVTGYLSDEHFISFLKRCKEALRGNGCIVVKDNVTKGKEKEFDDIDHSWTRPMAEFNSIFENAGLKVVLIKRQLHFPKENYPVWMFALKPAL